MTTPIPTAAEIRGRLVRLSHSQMVDLAEVSCVPFTTLWKIRTGETANPRIDTVGQFYAHMEAPPAAQIVEGASHA